VQAHLYDTMQGAAHAGIAKIAKNLDRGVELGKFQQSARDAALARITPFDELTPACSQVGFYRWSRYGKNQ
jgi:3-hydroxyacyl-CoA dehydrogenase